MTSVCRKESAYWGLKELTIAEKSILEKSPSRRMRELPQNFSIIALKNGKDFFT